MKNKSMIVAAMFLSAHFFAQNSSAKVTPGKDGFYPENIRFNKGQEPSFNNMPVLYDEVSKNISIGQGLKIKSDKDALGVETSRFQQTINGIPVEYGIVNVHVKDGKIIGQNGVWVKGSPQENAAASLQKGINEQIALSNALNFVGAESYKWQDAEEEKFLKSESKDESATFYPKGKLVYYFDPSDLNSKKMTLAYKFDIYAQAPLSRQYVFVDAKTGAILGTDSIIKETNTPGTAVTAYSGTQSIVTDKVSATSYRLRESGRNAGTAVETYNLKKGTSYSKAVDFTDTDNNWNNVNTTLDQYAPDAHYGAEKTLDFYYANFGRKSIDNNNFAIKSYIHYSRNYFNAFWDGTRMTYGDGSSVNGNKPLTALDVCGHEITHGLTTFTANLAYQKESGALNEGFSDIFGNSVEFWARPTKSNWKLGEDFNYVIRDMANPNAYQQPDTYLGTYWVNVVGCTPNASTNDSCGVHTNSGVLNYWYYLLTNGGSGTNDKGFAYSVTGVGLTKSAAIAYRTLTTYLTSASNYLNARTYSLQAAADLYGATSNEYIQVKNAWNAVGVGGGTSAAGKTTETTEASIYQVVADTNKAMILFNSASAGAKNIELISMTGKKIVSTSAKAVVGANRLEVAIPANTSTGVYLVIVNGEKAGSFIRK